MGQVTSPVAFLLLLRDLQFEVTLDDVLEPVLEVGQPIGKDATSQHGAKYVAFWIQLMLLQPTQIEHSVVG